MRQRIFPPVFIGKFAVGIVVLFLTQFAAAQFESDMRTPYPADPRDTRFVSVKEDWTTPGLSSSSLKPAQPLVADISSNPEEYRVELVRLQWRFGDPIDLYVLKPAGVKSCRRSSISTVIRRRPASSGIRLGRKSQPKTDSPRWGL